MTYPPSYVIAAPKPASGTATAALVLGIVGFLAFFLVVPSLLAIVCGHAGLRETRGGEKSGYGMAVAGLVMGYLIAVPMVATFALLAGYAVIGSA